MIEIRQAKAQDIAILEGLAQKLVPDTFQSALKSLYLENRIWKIQNIKWLNRKILTMPIETSEEVIFKKVTTKRIVKV